MLKLQYYIKWSSDFSEIGVQPSLKNSFQLRMVNGIYKKGLWNITKS